MGNVDVDLKLCCFCTKYERFVLQILKMSLNQTSADAIDKLSYSHYCAISPTSAVLSVSEGASSSVELYAPNGARSEIGSAFNLY